MKSKTGLVNHKSYRSTRTVTADWRPVKANDGSPTYVGYVASPHPTNGSIHIDTYAIWDTYLGALGQAQVSRAGAEMEETLAMSTIEYDTKRPNESNLCYRAFEGAWFYEPYPQRAVVWPEPKWIFSSSGFRPDGTMFRAARFRGYPSTFGQQTTYDGEPRNLPTLLEKQNAGRQLAAGPSKGLDGLLTSIIEMKDVPATLKGLFSFAKFLWQLKKKPSNLLSKATVKEVVGLYLNFTYGVSPTLSECERFRDRLVDELRKARTSIDAMFEAASDSLQKSNRDYRKWLAAREKRDEEARILRESRLAQREAERKARQLEARILKQRREDLKGLLKLAQRTREDLIDELHAERLDAYARLESEGAVRDAIKASLDELWYDRQAALLDMQTHIENVAAQQNITFEVLEYYRDLAWIEKFHSLELMQWEQEYKNLQMEIERTKQEREDYKASIALYRETVLAELERSYEESESIQEYLHSLSTVEDEIARQELHILDLQSDLSYVHGQLEKLYDRPPRHSDGRTPYGSTELTRTYEFPKVFVSARRRLYKEPDGVPRTVLLDDSGSVSYEVTYSMQGWDIVPDPTATVSSLLSRALERLYRGHMATVCRQAVIYKQWPLSELSSFYTPFGRMCDFAHAFLQPLNTMWQIMPWSFVADWFADLSATFGAVEAEFTRRVTGLPETPTWSSCSFLALLATNLDNPVPVNVEQEWISDPSKLATSHTVRYTFRINTPSRVRLGGSSGDAFVRRPEPSGGVAEFLPPPNLSKVFDHSLEGLALLTQQLLK